MKIEYGIGIHSCSECETMNSAIRCMRTLQFMYSNGNVGLKDGVNFRSALEFDREKQEILVNEELLMQAIILANPGQEHRKIRLISNEEFKERRNKRHRILKSGSNGEPPGVKNEAMTESQLM